MWPAIVRPARFHPADALVTAMPEIAFALCIVPGSLSSSMTRTWCNAVSVQWRTRRRRPPTMASSPAYAEPSKLYDNKAEDKSNAAGSDNGEDRVEKTTDSVEALLDSVAKFVNMAFDRIVDPFVGSCSLLQGKWERAGGNYLLRPVGRAKAVIHFIGGAFSGAAPHIFYRTLLEMLVSRGYCIVASPYELRLDYLATTAEVVAKWEAVETDLALEYGAIPVVGLGHSAGALFHSIASSLFEDMSPKAGNILVSFNNMSIKDAIPLYDIAVLPIAKQSTAFEQSLPTYLRETLESLPGTVDAAVEGSLFTPKRFKQVFLPVIKEGRRVVEQLVPLIREIGGVPRERNPIGEEQKRSKVLDEFYPPPSDVAIAVSSMYRVSQTLIVQFSNDRIDESDKVLGYIRQSGDENEVSLMEIRGNHLTPLAQEVTVASSMETENGSERLPDIFGIPAAILNEAAVALGIRDVTVLVSLIDEWVESGIASDKL